jgi:hypothetical protein
MRITQAWTMLMSGTVAADDAVSDSELPPLVLLLAVLLLLLLLSLVGAVDERAVVRSVADHKPMQ